MELTLNLAWLLLATAMVSLWLGFGLHSGRDRHLQMVALVALILILFPVISVTDDLQAAQNPAETASCLRRDHEHSNSHSIVPAAALLPQPIFAGLSFGILRTGAPCGLPSPLVKNPALSAVQNRPPPSA